MKKLKKIKSEFRKLGVEKALHLLFAGTAIAIAVIELNKLTGSIEENSQALEGSFSPLLQITENRRTYEKKESNKGIVNYELSIKNIGNSTAHNIKIFAIIPSNKWNLVEFYSYEKSLLKLLIEENSELVLYGKEDVLKPLIIEEMKDNSDVLKKSLSLTEGEKLSISSWKATYDSSYRNGSVTSPKQTPTDLYNNVTLIISYCDLIGACYVSDAFNPHLKYRFGNFENDNENYIYGDLSESSEIFKELVFNRNKYIDDLPPLEWLGDNAIPGLIKLLSRIDELYAYNLEDGEWIKNRALMHSETAYLLHLVNINAIRENSCSTNDHYLSSYYRLMEAMSVLIENDKLNNRTTHHAFAIKYNAPLITNIANTYSQLCIDGYRGEISKGREKIKESIEKAIKQYNVIFEKSKLSH